MNGETNIIAFPEIERTEEPMPDGRAVVAEVAGCIIVAFPGTEAAAPSHRYIPPDCTARQERLDRVVYHTPPGVPPVAIGYIGRRRKPEFHHTFPLGESHMTAFIQSFLG